MSSDMDLSHLTAEEKESILAVLERDNALRKAEELRIKGLKDELRALRLRGVMRNDGEAAEGCSRCGEQYGRVFNKGAVCVQCLQMVCGRCRQSAPGGEFLCIYCSKQNELEAKCGNWFYSKMPKKSNQVVTGSDVTRASLLRIRPTLKSRRNRTAQELTSFEENNNNNARSPLSSLSSQPDRSSCNLNGPRDEGHSVSPLGSPVSSSMPSIAVNATKMANGKSIVPVNGVPSDEENEDIGEMFALYGARRSNSQTNLNKLSVFSGSKESLNSCYSDAGEENYGKFPVSGEILFGLNYNYTINALEITIRRCKDLAVVDTKRNKSDPYVKTYLLPDRTKTGKRKTRVKKHTLDPVYDEVLKYQITKSELETRTLNVMVWNSDRFGRNDFLGEVSISLDYYPFDNPTPLWHKLRDRSLGPAPMLAYKGDLSVCLKFVSAEHISGRRRSANYRGELQVVVKEARNLSAVRSNGYSDPFCKGYLLPDRSHQSKQKTAVVRKNCNPKWNHTFLFENVSWDELAQRSLELTIWDYDRLTSNDFLGGVRLNIGNGRSFSQEVTWMDATGSELTLWQSMLDRPNCWIEGTMLLRLNMNQSK